MFQAVLYTCAVLNGEPIQPCVEFSYTRENYETREECIDRANLMAFQAKNDPNIHMMILMNLNNPEQFAMRPDCKNLVKELGVLA